MQCSMLGRTIGMITMTPSSLRHVHVHNELDRPEEDDAVLPLSLVDELEMQRLLAELEAFLEEGHEIRQHYQAKAYQIHAAAA
jgi:hypothetical protein